MDLTTRFFLTRPPMPLFHGLLRFRRGLRSLRARVMPVNAELIERSFAMIEARALGLAADLDLAEHVAGGRRTSAELAAITGSDPDALDRLLHMLAATGVFRQRSDGTWANTRLSAGLRGGHPLSMRSWMRFFGGGDHFRIWGSADVSLRTGASATERATGHEFFEWTTSVAPEAGALFDGAMQEASRFLALSLARTVDLDGVSTVCDVGGGTGQLVATLVARRRGLRGILFDLPAVVRGAGPVLAAAAVADRVETVGGSFFDEVPAGADRYVLVSVVHDWDDERSLTILERCREAMPPHGRIWVVEQVLDPGAPPFISRHTDLLMLVLTGAGRERSDEHFRDLFGRVGLTVARTYELATFHRVYELARTGA